MCLWITVLQNRFTEWKQCIVLGVLDHRKKWSSLLKNLSKGDKEVYIHSEEIRKVIRKMATNKKIEFFFLHHYLVPIRFQNITGLLINLIKQIVFLRLPHGFSSPVGYGNEAIVKNIKLSHCKGHTNELKISLPGLIKKDKKNAHVQRLDGIIFLFVLFNKSIWFKKAGLNFLMVWFSWHREWLL